MAKLHTRQKRYLQISSTYGGFKRPKKKYKSFKSEESAKRWAESLKLNNYEIVKPCLGLSKKFKVKIKK